MRRGASRGLRFDEGVRRGRAHARNRGGGVSWRGGACASGSPVIEVGETQERRSSAAEFGLVAQGARLGAGLVAG